MTIGEKAALEHEGLGPVASPTAHKSTLEAAYQITRDNYDWGTSIHVPAGPISFGFRTVQPGYTVDDEDVQGTFTAFSVAEQAAARSALRLWSEVANITFADQGNSNSAAIEFANYRSSNDASEAFAFYPSNDDRSSGSSDGDVFFNTFYYSTTSAAPGTYEFTTALHEIGHALGLQHPGDYNAGPGQDITYDNSAQYVEDDNMYTLMSYFDETNTGGQFFVYDETPMMDDIAAIQRLYGANMTTRTGNTTYGFHSNAGSPYAIADSGVSVAYCVWDAGGADTFDFSGYSENATISLVQASFSSVGGSTYNVSIARGVNIENAIGGGGNDTIIGNNVANTLHGLAGDDRLNGGAGADTLAGGAGNDVYTVDRASDQVIEAGTVAGSDTVYASASYALGAGQSVEWLATSQLSGTAAINLSGNENAQVIYGNNGANVIAGGAGDDTIYGQGGADTIVGGLGFDMIDPGAGADRIDFYGVSQSTGVTADLVSNLNLSGVDHFDLTVLPTAVRATVTHGGLNAGHFDANLAAAVGAVQLGANQAVLFDPDAGDLNVAGHVFMVVDANGVAGYQAGQDYVVELANASGTLTVDDFI